MESKDGRKGEITKGSPRGPELDRLPPPAFPPGDRRAWVPRATRAAGRDDPDLSAGALISPEEPIRRIGDTFDEEAFISPDDPFEHAGDAAPEQGGGGEADQEAGEVTGIGDPDPEAYRSVAAYAGPRDPDQVAGALEELARSLREQGTAALTTSPHLSPFESALRGFLGGYMVGRGGDAR